jgi:hypothetical protein
MSSLFISETREPLDPEVEARFSPAEKAGFASIGVPHWLARVKSERKPEEGKEPAPGGDGIEITKSEQHSGRWRRKRRR